MAHFSSEVHQIADDKDKERFDDFDMLCVLGDESSEETKQNANESSSNGYDEEGAQSSHNINGLDIGLSNFNEALEHVIQYLEYSLVQFRYNGTNNSMQQ